MPTFHRPVVRWESLPSTYECSLDVFVYRHFQERKFHVNDALIPDLWAIVLDFFMHKAYYVSLPPTMFAHDYSFIHLIRGDILLTKNIVRFFGLENGASFMVGKTLLSGYGNIHVKELEHYHLPIELSIGDSDRFLFKFEPRCDQPLRYKTGVIHTWPTLGKVFSMWWRGRMYLERTGVIKIDNNSVILGLKINSEML